jgi:hypothetical protein
MAKRLTMLTAVIVAVIALSAHSFSFPQLFWPQKDMDSSSVNQPSLAKKILVASRDSDYKRALVEKIKEGLKGDSVYIKCIGLGRLKFEDASSYRAIVLINTCMAWDWDRNIHKFLKGKKNAANVIVLTTSGSGKWMPKRNPAGVDAIASASEKTGVATVAADIVQKAGALLEKK